MTRLIKLIALLAVSCVILVAVPVSATPSQESLIRFDVGPQVALAGRPPCNGANDGLMWYEAGVGWYECQHDGVQWRWRFISDDPIFVIDGRAVRVFAEVPESHLGSVSEVLYELFVAPDATVDIVELPVPYAERFVIHRDEKWAKRDLRIDVTVVATERFDVVVSAATHGSRDVITGSSNKDLTIRLR